MGGQILHGAQRHALRARMQVHTHARHMRAREQAEIKSWIGHKYTDYTFRLVFGHDYVLVAFIAMAYKVMAYILMAYIVVAYTAMA